METESQAKIAIRGKGSVKEGKGKSDAAHASNQDEDLHCLIMADTEEKVNKAKKLIHNVIETVCIYHMESAYRSTNVCQAASIPEGQNELKRNQLRELAALNGTLRDDENQACQNCGEIGHRKYDCPQQRNFTANIICRVCGNAGHMARDCPDRARGQDWRNNGPPRGQIEGGDTADDEYANLMKELQGGGADLKNPARQIGYEGGNQDANGDGQANVRSWQRGPTGGPAPWNQHRGQASGPAPWNDPRGGNYDSGYNAVPPPGGQQAPWQQNRQQPPPWAQNGNMGAPPPCQQQQNPGYDIPPPPPPEADDNIPPPPPPPA